jgi:hypothetical protein
MFGMLLLCGDPLQSDLSTKLSSHFSVAKRRGDEGLSFALSLRSSTLKDFAEEECIVVVREVLKQDVKLKIVLEVLELRTTLS